MTFLVLMVLSVTHPNWSSNGDGDNPDGGKGSIVKRLAEFIPAKNTVSISYLVVLQPHLNIHGRL
jgi:hypothetical protein